ncbi:MAG: PqiC family protein, partial [Pseudomonadota bacterium]|nr:PqiC family protein [Pseudomonadota bacterium]
VSIGPITVPDTVDRAQMVIRKGASEVEQREDRRWAEPLRNAIARALSRDLGAALPDMVTSVRSDSAVDPHPNYRVAVDFLRFDSELGAAATIEARWRIQSDGKQVLTGQFERREPTAGADYADLANAHARALAGLSQQVAKALRTFTTPK